MVSKLRGVIIEANNYTIYELQPTLKLIGLLEKLMPKEEDPIVNVDMMASLLTAARYFINSIGFDMKNLSVLDLYNNELNGFSFGFYEYQGFDIISIQETKIGLHEGLKILPPKFIMDLGELVSDHGPIIGKGDPRPKDFNGFKHFFKREDVSQIMNQEYRTVIDDIDLVRGLEFMFNYGPPIKESKKKNVKPQTEKLPFDIEECYDYLNHMYEFSNNFAITNDYVAIMSLNHKFGTYVDIDWSVTTQEHDREGSLIKVKIGEQGFGLGTIIQNVLQRLKDRQKNE